MTRRLTPVAIAVLALAGCKVPPERPMDEVPEQTNLMNGDRQYRFVNDCLVILEPQRAVVISESESCELHHRDIALLYASGD